MLPEIAGLMMFVGSYGSSADTTITIYDFNLATAGATAIQAVTGVENASFLCPLGGGSTLLAVNENEEPAAAVTLLRPDDFGQYRAVDRVRTHGGAPCHIVAGPGAGYAVTANYSGGSFTIVPLDTATARLGDPTLVQLTGRSVVRGQQDGPHAHFTSFTPDGRTMIVNDLGTDRLHCFPLDGNGRPMLEKVSDVRVEPGSGPRHLVYGTHGENAYLINEIGGTVAHLRREGERYVPQSYTLADYGHGHGSGDIHLSPDGRFLYVSNRLKGDGIAVFEVDSLSGGIKAVGFTPTGRHPRNFAITPGGEWVLVACRDDNRIEIYRRNRATGTLTATGRYIPCTRPVCVVFARD